MRRGQGAALCAIWMESLLLLAGPRPASATDPVLVSGTVLRTEVSGTSTRAARGDLFGEGEIPGALGPAIGRYALRSLAGDLRANPTIVSLTASDGTLVARVRAVRSARRVDTSSGRPIAPGAPADAQCLNGNEPTCMHSGDAPAANRFAFDAMCDTGRGFDDVDPTRCALDLFQSTAFLGDGPTLAQLFSQVFAGSPTGIEILHDSGVSGDDAYAPLVSLLVQGGDGSPAGYFAWDAMNGGGFGGAWPFAHRFSQTLAQVLTPQQAALLGCGPFYGTHCDGGANSFDATPAPGGVDLLRAEAGALLQSFAPSDAAFRTDDATVVQPGTSADTSLACDREGSYGTVIRLPGCYEVGGVAPQAEFPAGVDLVPLLGSASLGPIRFAFGHPFTGQLWRSEMAALSWNFQALLVMWTADVGTPGLPQENCFDPSRPYRTDGCSFVEPQLCGGVQVFRELASPLAAGDPTGRPSLRFAWENGGEFSVESATGRFAPLAGGSVLASSLLSPRAPGAPAGVSFLIFAPANADADGDGVPNAADRCLATADAAQDDADGDGAGDACDDCQNVSNPDQRDSNGDGIGNACDADLDDNGVVNFTDLARMKAVFFGSDADADLDGNGTVNFADLARLKQRFFQAPGPSALTQ